MRKFAYIFLLSFLFSDCTDSITEVEYVEIPMEEEIQLSSSLIVKVDPRIELLSVVQHFTTWAEIRHTKYESRYKAEVQKYFNIYSNHAAIQLSQELTNSGFAFDAQPNFMLYHSNPPEFEQVVEYSNSIISRAGSIVKLEIFAQEMRNFAVETDFMSFIETQKAYFRKIENDIKRTIGEQDYIEIIENYYGTEQNSYSITPASLFHTGGYAALIESGEGNDIYNICGPLGSFQGIPSFGDESSFQYILLHEFSHSFVNPLTEEHKLEVNQSSQLFEPIRTRMVNMHYGNWQSCVNEHLVRTNVARFLNNLQGEEAKNTILINEYNEGFIYINGLDSLMQIYEVNRIEYPTYSDFYTEILKYFESSN